VPIHTVLGPIEAAELGRTSMHEHLLVDGRVWLSPPREEPPDDPRVTMANLGFIRWNFESSEDNLVIDDPDLVTKELSPVVDYGGSGVVDLTVIGLGRRVAELPEIARRARLHVMVGCGFYVHASHPDWVERASVDELSEFIVNELRDGINGTGIRPALIGEIGTSEQVTEREKKVVQAAGKAGALTGAAVNIHLDPLGMHALEILEHLVAEGIKSERVIFSHLDNRLDRGYHRAVAESGAILEYDCFGSEFYAGDLYKGPSDYERCEYVTFLLEEGFARQLVLGCDVWAKANLRTYGGMGYEHLLKRIVPLLKGTYGIGEEVLDEMLIHTPRRLLDRPSLASSNSRADG
jgi:phosphotriesterase-related protein